ncbi:MAG: phosphoadenosine phosphosulfate reductase [Novosphingobium sp. 28-62-57]|uniref:phosphoadenylyl-sulfate reductase n=1 Tax=unclassified Novosphingobium TaxID=2644732 RepID=UPI000BD93EB9|nr:MULTISPECIES: phosphoadenylyl-sulfate reductase [unclassified Novosphingobium]OYW49034.1 MAG: phosphoadenosine phosphosulfate reductase [Novosphingobium sp. 12-62-10]OYZ09498.1 MAG: phosphoadenosine phosphosulfate reductase [Novosphingobium sp. 28-62-57]OZA30944.1 MAG: phosphoadenosine phosphosulfate reductase [Novosphingobium sp. 17-62-9]HQS70739.1 phosphoadenylyl-sulfate reductase [Novosphingobium sp.]
MTSTVNRKIDLIDARPRFVETDAIRLNQLFRGSDTQEMLRSVIRDGLAGDLAVVSSFGAESAVLLHLIAEVDPSVPVLFLETGKHFPETVAYRDELIAFLGMTNLQIIEPDPEAIAKKDENGLRWSWDPDGCCEIRKVEPLAKALLRFDASLTGRKGFQSKTRAGLPRFEIDHSDAQGRLKINPLASWDKDALAAYFVEHNLPAHPLVAQGYPSIGCAPCTSKVAPGEDPRSGRWKGWDKVECGIHTPTDGKTPGDELPPGYDPVF